MDIRNPFTDPEDMTGFDEACAFFEDAPVLDRAAAEQAERDRQIAMALRERRFDDVLELRRLAKQAKAA